MQCITIDLHATTDTSLLEKWLTQPMTDEE